MTMTQKIQDNDLKSIQSCTRSKKPNNIVPKKNRNNNEPL